MDQVPLARHQTVNRVGQVAGNLAHPQAVRSRSDPADLHSSGRQLDEKQHNESLQSFDRPDLDREEVRCHDQVPVLRQEFFPRRLAASLWRRFHPVAFENVSGRVPGKFVSQIG